MKSKKLIRGLAFAVKYLNFLSSMRTIHKLIRKSPPYFKLSVTKKTAAQYQSLSAVIILENKAN